MHSIKCEEQKCPITTWIPSEVVSMSLFNALVLNIQFVNIINTHGLGEATHCL